jgi:hypothetical protein
MKITNQNSFKNRPAKKIGNSHILWFEESNSWIQLEEPAWYIYTKLNSGVEAEIISRKFSRRYGLNRSESLAFVNEIINETGKLCTSSFKPTETFSAEEFISPKEFFSKHLYRLNQKRFEISYGSRLLEYMIHPSLAHLEIKTKSEPHFRLETFPAGLSSVLKVADKALVEEDANLLKRRLFIEVAGMLYGKSDRDWLSFVHGSAVSNGRESIILSTACGSGKSTLAALLCKNGLQFVSDDYVPIDARFCKAYAFPAALSVKDGAFPVLSPLYQQLNTTEVFHFKGSYKTVRYLSFPVGKDFYKPLPVRNLVFVQFDPSKDFSFRKVSVPEAIRRFNEEAWVSSSPAHARKFIKWFPGINCYELEYSDNERAIREISGLFN